jgi:hypothetical protein
VEEAVKATDTGNSSEFGHANANKLGFEESQSVFASGPKARGFGRKLW